MATLVSQIQALIDYANGITKKSDAKLGDAVKSLADNYGNSGDSSLPDNYGELGTLSAQLQALITYANSVDGQSDTHIGEAMHHLAEGGSVLPSGYTECEYIESSGKQYILTDYTPLIGDSFDIKQYKVNSVGTLLSAGTSTYQLILLFYDMASNLFYKYFASGTAITCKPSFEGEIIIDSDGTLHVGTNTYQSTPSGDVNTNLYLFARANNSGYISAQLGIVKASRGSDIVMELHPCLDADNKPCMYDIKSKKTYYNQGSGTFGYKTSDGTIVNPS